PGRIELRPRPALGETRARRQRRLLLPRRRILVSLPLRPPPAPTGGFAQRDAAIPRARPRIVPLRPALPPGLRPLQHEPREVPAGGAEAGPARSAPGAAHPRA